MVVRSTNMITSGMLVSQYRWTGQILEICPVVTTEAFGVELVARASGYLYSVQILNPDWSILAFS